jgi:predicted dehydrogenase/threonine dehydrogenase-like Zn-dependent dehydrogenase
LKQILIKAGGVVVEKVPAPQVSSKSILVKVSSSCVSVGTEMTGVKGSGQPLYRRALQQPEKVKQALEMVKQRGLKNTTDFLRSKKHQESPTGYSAAGEIVAIGDDVEGFSLGQHVACAGAGIANHAEIIDVPVNLAVKMPESLSFYLASTVTLGAIAMQGVRRTNPTLGETIVVVGLGILGQITVQLLTANGCRVIGIDIDPDRINTAIDNGMHYGIDPAAENYVERVHLLTENFGADAVIVTAAAKSNEIISEAMQTCRKKGRVVLVGDVGLDLKREDFYAKELDFFISTSYGPGRYDPVYEQGGNDYPLPYVRWTENRNMEEFLKLLSEKKITLENMYEKPYPVENAAEAYNALKNAVKKPLLVLLAYSANEDAFINKVIVRHANKKNGLVNVALAGAGGFAQSAHLPNMAKLSKKYQLHAVMSRTGANAKYIAKQYNAEYATSSYEELLKDESVDLVFVTTRHNLHAKMVLQALKSGKNVFVEKPLALRSDELDMIEEFYKASKQPPVLMTGFNRRFSPALQRAKSALKNCTTPLIVNYRMNAGYIPLDVWVHGNEGGGRNIGEACHIYDLFNYLTDAEVETIHASAVTPKGKQWTKNDNFVATVKYTDGSVCTLTYTAMGNKSESKEKMEIYFDGKVITMDDYQSLTVAGSKGLNWNSKIMQKGLLEEIDSLADSILSANEWPISLEQQIQATRTSFEVERQINGET